MKNDNEQEKMILQSIFTNPTKYIANYEERTVWQKIMTNPIYYIERSLRIRHFVMRCMPVFLVVEFFLILFIILGFRLLK